jgi:excisionase family DNA binding protein
MEAARLTIMAQGMTPRELAHLVGVKPQTIHNYISQDRIKATSVFGRRFIPQSEVDKYLANRAAKAQKRAEQIERELNAT